MAELSAADKRAIFGPDYKEPEVTDASRAERKAASRVSMRNMAIGFAFLGLVILYAVFYRS